MNLLEHYIKKVISIKPCEEEWTLQYTDMEFFKVKLICGGYEGETGSGKTIEDIEYDNCEKSESDPERKTFGGARFELNGYYQSGWKTTVGRQFGLNDVIPNLTTVDGDEIELTAVYELKKCSITLNLNVDEAIDNNGKPLVGFDETGLSISLGDASDSFDNKSVDDTIVLPAPSIDENHEKYYEFLHWLLKEKEGGNEYTYEDGKEITISSTESVSNSKIKYSDEIKLIPVFKLLTCTVNISVDNSDDDNSDYGLILQGTIKDVSKKPLATVLQENEDVLEGQLDIENVFHKIDPEEYVIKTWEGVELKQLTFTVYNADNDSEYEVTITAIPTVSENPKITYEFSHWEFSTPNEDNSTTIKAVFNKFELNEVVFSYTNDNWNSDRQYCDFKLYLYDQSTETYPDEELWDAGVIELSEGHWTQLGGSSDKRYLKDGDILKLTVKLHNEADLYRETLEWVWWTKDGNSEMTILETNSTGKEEGRINDNSGYVTVKKMDTYEVELEFTFTIKDDCTFNFIKYAEGFDGNIDASYDN